MMPDLDPSKMRHFGNYIKTRNKNLTFYHNLCMDLLLEMKKMDSNIYDKFDAQIKDWLGNEDTP